MTEEHVIRVPIKPGMKAQVEAQLEAQNRRQTELAAAHGGRNVQQLVCFTDSLGGSDWLYIYRRGDDLTQAGAKFLLSNAEVDKEWSRLLLEATEFDRATVLPVPLSWLG